uniref:Uncharacterized protein n=1 Tax=Rhodosorus marinus TaxID=101924 RepID=A0A7S3ER10_9RHOD|mmetsp:Transcript_9947/g.42024  ORF Transcript_9947/g.42024 Transcript_9947/m.42024 type:complete len:228 (+) Transcript_9947:334-1017(+)
MIIPTAALLAKARENQGVGTGNATAWGTTLESFRHAKERQDERAGTSQANGPNQCPSAWGSGAAPPTIPLQGAPDLSAILSAKTCAVYDSILKLRKDKNRSGRIAGNTLQRRTQESRRTNCNGPDISRTLQKSRRSTLNKGPNLSPATYKVLRGWLIEKRQKENAKYTDDGIDKDLFALAHMMKNTNLDTLSRGRFYKFVSRGEEQGVVQETTEAGAKTESSRDVGD